MTKPTAFVDPYDTMSNAELEAHLATLRPAKPKPATVAINLRMEQETIARLRTASTQLGLPYQTLAKRLIDSGLDAIDAQSKRTSRPGRTR